MSGSEEMITTDNGSSDRQTADDWIAAFAKKSQEALAKKAAEKKIEPPPDEKALIAALARKDHTEYDRMRADLAETLGMRVGTLDDKVEALRKKLKSEDDEDALPHWKVEPWSEPVDCVTLLNSIKQVFRRYIVLPQGADVAIALWVLHAWTFDAGEISPFLVVVSPTKRCGKTSALIVLYYLTPRSELASNISPSAIFRYIEQTHPTLLMDEGESFLRDNEEARGILDSGHTKAGAYVIRNVEVAGEHKPRRFSTWAPKAIATIRGLADTLEDRSVVVRLQRKPPSAKVERLRRRDNKEFAHLRSQAARWAADNFDKLTDPDPVVPEALNDRAADNWRPLLEIADLAGGTWPEDARRAACTLSGQEHDGAINVELLRDIRSAFGDAEMIRSVDLVEKLVADKERPWADWKHGRPLSQKQLGGLLRPFCIISETLNLGSGQYAKGYRRAHFEEAWEVYCPGQNTLPAQSGTSEASFRHNADEMGTTRDFRSVTSAKSDGSKSGNLSYSHAGCGGMTDRKAQNGGQGYFDQEIAYAKVARQQFEDACKASLPTGRPRRFPVCAQCKSDVGKLERLEGSKPPVDLHRECRRVWLKDHGLLGPEDAYRCDHCGQPGTRTDPLKSWDWPGRPDGIWLHPRCEGPFHDAHNPLSHQLLNGGTTRL